MSDEKVENIHWSFWAIGVVALIWHAMGIMNYLGQMNPESLEAYPDSHRAIIDGRPAWATSGFAISVFAGAIGGLLLLLKKSMSAYLFIASLIGSVVATVHTINVAGTVDFTGGEILMMILSPIVFSGLLVWFTKRAESRGWIG